VNVGVVGSLMVIVIVAVVAQVGVPAAAADGVNVYVCEPTVAVEIVVGFHVPEIGVAFVEFAGKLPGVASLQYGPSCVNVGVVGSLMVIVIVAVVAQVGVPAADDEGVKVYDWDPAVAVEIVVGFHVPEIGVAFVEFAGKLPGVASLQYGPSCVKVGVVGSLMVIVIVAVVAHVGVPAAEANGVNVYVWEPAVVVEIVDGFQVPEIGVAFVEFAGKLPGVASLQYGPSCVKVGVVSALTVIVIDAVVAHVGEPVAAADGVNVYVCEPTAAVEIVVGFHVPEIGVAFVEFAGKLPGVASLQYGPSWLNVGVVSALTVIVIDAVVAHVGVPVAAAEGVNV
jgi:hypothetical protein